jgi:hypothetical protein
VLRVVVVDQLPRASRRATVAGAIHRYTQRDEVASPGLRQARACGSREEIARHDLYALHVHRLQLEQAELADRLHDVRVARIPQRLVFHRRDLSLVPERHGGEAARGVKRLEVSDRGREPRRLTLGQCLYLRPLAITQNPRQRRVVVEHTLQRVHDLVVQRRLRILRQPTDVDPHALDAIHRANAHLGENVHHAGREATVGDDRDAALAGQPVERLLLEDDLGVAAEIAEVDTRLGGVSRHIEVEVIRERAHDRVALAHERADRLAVADIHRRRDQLAAGIGREKVGQMIRVQVRQANLGDIRLLEQIIRARGALEPRAKYQHSHSVCLPKRCGIESGKVAGCRRLRQRHDAASGAGARANGASIAM